MSARVVRVLRLGVAFHDAAGGRDRAMGPCHMTNCHSERSAAESRNLSGGASLIGTFPERCFDCASGYAQHDKVGASGYAQHDKRKPPPLPEGASVRVACVGVTLTLALSRRGRGDQAGRSRGYGCGRPEGYGTRVPALVLQTQ